jgi:hypothetical protein
MINWNYVLLIVFSIAYLIVLTLSLLKWHGFKVAVRKHSNAIAVMILLTILFVAMGGVKYVLLVVLFGVVLAVVFTLIAGPMGFVVGLYFGVMMGLYLAFHSIFG